MKQTAVFLVSVLFWMLMSLDSFALMAFRLTDNRRPSPGVHQVNFPDHPDWNFTVTLKKNVSPGPSVFPVARKIFAVPDMEGEFEVFRKLLIAAKVIDKHYNWIFGEGHLVICGDLFDRGIQVEELLWLIYKLEDLARANGGNVHVILGNHDHMNFSGDYRYVDEKYLAAARERGIPYSELYGKNTELGRWLRSKNLMEKIGDKLFVHGGVSREMNQLGWTIDQFNERCRPYLDMSAKKMPEPYQTIFGRDGLLWYRGYFMDRRADSSVVEESLVFFGVKEIAVGHTIAPENIGFSYSGRVLGLDVEAHQGVLAGALFQDGSWYKVNGEGRKQELLSQELLRPENWITAGDVPSSLTVLSKDFVLDGGRVASAKLYITAMGLYEASLNGKKISDAYFCPGWTSYQKRLQYQVYDVTPLLNSSNILRVRLAAGWYSGKFGPDLETNLYGKGTALNCSLLIRYADGHTKLLNSGKDWRTGLSKIITSDFYSGEKQDLRVNEKLVFENASGYRPAFGVQLVSTDSPPVRMQESFKAIRSWNDKKGRLILDFGQNLAGFVTLKTDGRSGDSIQMEHAEILDSAGNFYTGNLRMAQAKDTYILSGRKENLSPVFTYHGFRYARISGATAAVNISSVRAVALYSDLVHSGNFSCSDPLVNRLQQNILWSMKSNFVDVPTDCPQRSERFGWTGDAQIFCKTAALNFQVQEFYKKYLADLAADQGTNGAVPNIIPDFIRPRDTIKRGVAGWGDAAVLIPWTLYQQYGDRALLSRAYPSMKRWVNYIDSVSIDGLWKANGYGDWYAQGDSTSLPFIDQCHFVRSAELLSKTAKLLGETQDFEKYQQVYQAALKQFISHYANFDTRATQTQTAYVLALAFDLLPENRRQEIADRLARSVTQNGNKLATGFLGTPELLPVLSRFGHSDLAYTLLFQKECPSWLYPVTKGATTIWEKWDAIKPDGTLQKTSFNHFAYGAVGRWFYENILGIQALAPGYQETQIRPEIDSRLKWAKGSFTSVYGRISSSWRIEGRKVRLQVEIPKGSTAKIYVPGENQPRVVNAGKYQFTGNIDL